MISLINYDSRARSRREVVMKFTQIPGLINTHIPKTGNTTLGWSLPIHKHVRPPYETTPCSEILFMW